MKRILTFFLYLLILCSGITDASAQYLKVKFQDGSEKKQEIGLIQNLIFPDSQLQINLLDRSAESYDLSTVSTLYFQQSLTATEDYLPDGSQAISIYPNPASDEIYIKNAPANDFVVSIYRIDGMLVSQKQVSSQSQPIDISFLSIGLYILRIDNQALKFVKQ